MSCPDTDVRAVRVSSDNAERIAVARSYRAVEPQSVPGRLVVDVVVGAAGVDGFQKRQIFAKRDRDLMGPEHLEERKKHQRKAPTR